MTDQQFPPLVMRDEHAALSDEHLETLIAIQLLGYTPETTRNDFGQDFTYWRKPGFRWPALIHPLFCRNMSHAWAVLERVLRLPPEASAEDEFRRDLLAVALRSAELFSLPEKEAARRACELAMAAWATQMPEGEGNG